MSRTSQPEPSPPELALGEEVAAIFEAAPDFKERLRVTVERVRAGTEALVEDAEVRRRLRTKGVG